jgi:hypothetical protein
LVYPLETRSFWPESFHAHARRELSAFINSASGISFAEPSIMIVVFSADVNKVEMPERARHVSG